MNLAFYVWLIYLNMIFPNFVHLLQLIDFILLHGKVHLYNFFSIHSLTLAGT